MKNFAGLERRVAVLERPMGIKIPAEEAALAILNDNEMGLLCEFIALMKSGYSLEQIRHMMEEETFLIAVEAIEKADQEYQRLTRPLARHFRSDIDLKRTKGGAKDAPELDPADTDA
jgi:hypothetical protein